MKINKRWLQSKNACIDGIDWVVQKCNDKDGIDVVKALLEDDKLVWANWLIVRIMTKPQYLGYAIYTAEEVIDIFEKKYSDDKRPRNAIEAAKKVLLDDTPENRAAANAAAKDANAAAKDANAVAKDANAAAKDAYAVAKDAYAVAKDAYAAYAASYAANATADDAYAVADATDAADAAANATADATMRIKILNHWLKLLEDSMVLPIET